MTISRRKQKTSLPETDIAITPKLSPSDLLIDQIADAVMQRLVERGVLAPSRKLYDVKTAAAKMGIGKNGVYALIDTGELPAIRFPDPKRSEYRIEEADMDRLIDRRLAEANQKFIRVAV